MAQRTTIKGEIVKEYLDRFPGTPHLTLAKTIYQDNPEAFKDMRNVYDVVRYYRGKHGERDKENVTSREHVETEERSKSPFENLPEPMTHFADWSPMVVDSKRSLYLSDIHVPYYSRMAVLLALEHGYKHDCDCVILAGDTIDFYTISRWQTDPRKRDLQGELDMTIDILTLIRNNFGHADIFYMIGNHEERWDRYMSIKAPELLGNKYLSFAKQINAKELDIQIISDKRFLRIGKLNVIHGHEFGSGTASPVNPARTFFLKGKECAIGGHYHKTSEHVEKTMTDKVISTWSAGCLCDLRPDYRPINSWNHGFAEIEKIDDVNFHVDNYKIIKGKVY